MIKNPKIVTGNGSLLVTKEQKKSLMDLRDRYDFDIYRIASVVNSSWKLWNKKGPSADSIYYPIGELDMHDAIAAAVTGHYTTETDAETIINVCMDTADEQELAVMEKVLELIRSYNTKY